jgi:hypothetical protein
MKVYPMASVHDHLEEDWRHTEQAFEAALTELRAPAAAAGLVLRQPHHDMAGWPHVLHAEVLPTGSCRVLTCLDVGLNDHGQMLLQTIPGEARTFASFQPRDKAFYVRRLRLIVEAALSGDD